MTWRNAASPGWVNRQRSTIFMCKANPLAFLQPPKASCLRESHSYARNRWRYAPDVKSTIGDERIAIVEGIRSGSIDAIKRIGQRRRRSFGHRRPAAGARRRSRRKDFAGAGRGCQWVRRTSSASRFSGRRNRSASAAMIAMARSGKLGPILPSGYRRRAP